MNSSRANKKIAKWLARILLTQLMVASMLVSGFPIDALVQKLADSKIVDQLYLAQYSNKVVDKMGVKDAQAAEIAQYTGGLLVYADNTVGTPKYQFYDNSTGFGSEGSAQSVGSAAINWIRVAASPTEDKWIIVTKDSAATNNVIKAQVCTGGDGSLSCGTPTTINSAQGTATFRNFDIAFENGGGGEAILVYGTSTQDELRYIKYSGGSWTGDAAITTTRTGNATLVEWVELTSRNGSDQIGIAYSDSADDVSAYRWSGSAVTDEATQAITTAANVGDVRKFDISFEANTGDMFVGAIISSAATIAYGTLSGTTWGFSTAIAPDFTTDGIDFSEPAVDPLNGNSDIIGIQGYDVLTSANTTEGYVWDGSAIDDDNNGDDPAQNWAANYALGAVSYLDIVMKAVGVISSTASGTDDIEWWYYSGSAVSNGTVNTRTRGASRFIDLFDYPSLSKVLLLTADANGDLWADTNDGSSTLGSAWTDLTSGGALELDLATTTKDVVDFAFRLAPPAMTISGTCQAYDQSTACTDGIGTVKVAVNGVVDSGGDATFTAGAWSFTPSSAPANGASIVVFIDGAADADEASAVTLYDGSGNIDNIRLYKEHVTIGTAGGANTGQTVAVSNMDDYDVTNDEDVFYDVMAAGTCNNVGSFTGLCVDGNGTAGTSTQEELYIVTGNTFAPAADIFTHDIEIVGTFTGNGNTYTASGSWLDTGTFTPNTSTVTLTSTTTETITSTGSSFNNLTLNGSGGVWTTQDATDINATLTITAGTLTQGNFAFTVDGATSVTGTLNTTGGATGTRTFTGAVTVNSGGTFNLSGQNPVSSFGAGITQSSANQINLGSGGSTLIGNLSGAGAGGFSFGGTLTIPSGTTTNNYTGGNVLIAGTLALNTGSWTQGANSNLNLIADTAVSGSGTFTASASPNTVNYGGSSAIIYPTTYDTLSSSGGMTNNGTTTVNTALGGVGGLTNGATGTLNIAFASAPNITTFTATASGNTVNYTAAAPNCRVATYHHLNFTGSGTVTCAVTTVNGNLGTSGTVAWTTGAGLTIGGNLTVGANTTLTQGNFAFTVTGTTGVSGTINTSGGATGTRTFTGAVTNNAGGTFDLSGQNPPTSFGAGVVQNSSNTFHAGSGSATFAGNFSGTGTGNIYFYGPFTVAGSQTTTNNYTGNRVYLEGDITLTGNLTQGSNSYTWFVSATDFAGAGTFTASASGNTVTYSNTGNVKSSTYNQLNTVGNRTISDTVTVNNDMGGIGEFIVGATGILNIAFASAPSVTTFTASASGSTVNYTAAAPNCRVVTYHHLNFTGSGTVTCAVTTVNGNLGTSGTVSWTTGAGLTIGGNLSVGNGTSMTTGANFTLQVSGTTTAGGGTNGTLALSNGGAKTLIGLVTVANGATFTVGGGSVEFRGGFTNNSGSQLTIASPATFTTTASQAISGSAIIFSSTLGIGTGVTLTNNATQEVWLQDTLTLTGNWTQGAASVLTFSAGTPFSGVGTFDASTNANTVTYAGTSQTVKAVTYRTLNIGAGATASIDGTVTVNTALGGTGALTNNTSGVLNIAFASAPTITTLTATASDNTVNYTAAAPNCKVVSYYHLNFTGSGTVTCAVTTVGGNLGLSGTVSWTTSSNIVVGNEIIIGSGTTLAGTNNITTNGGDITGDGDINMTGGTVTLNSAGNLGGATAWDFYNLNIGDGVGGLHQTTATGGITLAADLTVGSDQIFDLTTNEVYLLVNGNVIINGTLSGPDTNDFIVKGNWTNNGTFNEGTGKVSFEGATSTTINSGCADYTSCATKDFYQFQIYKTDANDANDNVTLTGHLSASNLINVSDGELVQGAYNIWVESVSVAAAGKWNNISTGDLKLGAGFANAGVVIFSSNNAAQCTDVADDIVISSTVASNVRTWSGAGTYTMRNIDVSDMSDGAITITIYTSTLSNTDWTEGNCGMTVSGVFYDADEVGTDPGQCGGVANLSLRVNGGTEVTTVCTATSGVFSFSGVSATAGQTITIYSTGANKANLVYVSDGTADTLMNLIENTLVVGNVNGGATTIENMFCGAGNDATCYDNDQNATDMLFDATDDVTDTLDVDDGIELHIRNSFDATGTVTTSPSSSSSSQDGDIHIASGATFTAGGVRTYCGGDFINEGTYNANSKGLYLTATTSGHSLVSNGNAMYSINIQDTSGGYTFTGATTMASSLTVSGSLAGSDDIEVGVIFNGNGTINMTGGTVTHYVGATRDFGTNADSNTWTFNNLTFRNWSGGAINITTGNGTGAINVAGILTVGSGSDSASTTLLAGAVARTWVMGYGGTDVCDPFQVHDTNGGFSYQASTVNYAGNCSTGDVNVENVDYNYLTLSGTDNFDFEGTAIVGADLTVTASAVLVGTDNITVNGGDITGTGDINLTGGTLTLDTTGNLGGAAAWDFNNLTLGNSLSGPTTTTASGAGGITLAGDLVVNSDQILAGTGNMTVVGSVTGAGTIDLSGGTGTFEQRVAAAENFGTTSANTWKFYKLIFSNSTGVQRTITRLASSNTIEVWNQLLVSKTGDSAGTELDTYTNGGYWTFYGDSTNEPLDIDQASGVLTANNSGTNFDFLGYWGSGDIILENGNASYAQFSIGDGVTSENYDFEGDVSIGANFSIADNARLIGTDNITIGTTYGGSLSGLGDVILTGGTFTMANQANSNISNDNLAWDFYNLIFGNGSFTTTVTALGAANVTVANNLTITANQTLDAGSKTWNIAGAYTNSGTLTENSSTFVFNGAASVNLNSACADYTSCATKDFYNLTINKTDAADGNDNVTLTGHLRVNGVLTITDGELVQGAYNVWAGDTGATGTAVSVAAAGKWNNISTGDLKLGAGFANAGVVIFSSNNAAQCTDVADDIVITSTTGGQVRTWSGAGTYTIRNVNVTDMSDGAITIYAYTSTRTNTDWSAGSCGFLVSGRFYQSDETTLPAGQCDLITENISLRVNGASLLTAACDNGNGSFNFPTVFANAGDIITIYATNSSANLVYKSDGTTDNDADLFENRLVVGSLSGSITIDDLAVYDSTANDTDMLFDAVNSTPDTLTVETNTELHIRSGQTFQPGGTVTTEPTGDPTSPTGDIHIDGTGVLDMGTNALSIGGDLFNEGTLTLASGQTTTFTSVSSSESTIQNGGDIFQNIIFNDGGSSSSWSITDAATTILGDVTFTDGTVIFGVDINVNGNVGGTNGIVNYSGTPTFTHEVASAKNFNPPHGANFYNLNFTSSSGSPTITAGSGDVVIIGTMLVSTAAMAGTGVTLDAGSKGWYFFGTSTNPFDVDQKSGSLIVSSSLFVYVGDAAGTITLEDAGYNNLTFAGSSSETYDFEGNVVISGDISFASGVDVISGTDNITVNGGAVTGNGDINLTGGTFTVNTAGNFGGTTAWDFYNLTIGGAGNATTTSTGAGGITVSNVLTIDTGDTLDAKGRTWTLSNASGANSAPLVINGTLDDTANTSTFAFTGNNTGGNTTIPALTAYNNVVLNNASETWAVNAVYTLSGDLTVTAGTLTGDTNFTVNGGDVTGDGTINMVAGSFTLAGTGSFGGNTGWNFNSLYFGDQSTTATTTSIGTGSITTAAIFRIYANHTLDAKGKTWNAQGTNGTPFIISGTLNDSTDSSTFVFSGVNASGDSSIWASTGYNNITLTPGSAENYTIGSSTVSLSGDLTINTNAVLIGTGDISVYGGDVVFAGTGDINLTGGTFLIDGTGSMNNGVALDFYNLTFGDGTGTATTTLGYSTAVANNLTVNANQTANYNTNDVCVGTTNLIINTSGVFSPAASCSVSISGTYTNDGTINESTSSIYFSGTASVNLNSSCADYTSCATKDFYNVFIDKSAAGDADDNITLTGHLRVNGVLTITDGELVQGAYNVWAGDTGATGTAVDIAAAGKWNNISTGDLKLGGGFASAGVVTFNSNNGTQCVDAANDIVISSTVTDTVRTWSGAGTFTMYNVDVYDMSDGAITITIYTSTKDAETDWTHGSCGISIQGVVYMSNESTVATTGNSGPCDGSTAVISIRRNNGTASTGFCNGTTGAYNITLADTPSAGDTITIYLTSTMKANLVYVSDGTADTDMHLYENTVVVGNVNGGATTILDLVDYDSTTDDTNMLYNAVDTTTDTVTTEDGVELHIRNNFTPTGTVTTNVSNDGTDTNKDGDLHIATGATLAFGDNDATIGGDWLNQGDFTYTNYSFDITFSATATGHTIAANGDHFYRTWFTGAGGGYSFSDATTYTDSNINVNAGTLSGTTDIITGGGVIGTAGVINLTGGTLTMDVGGDRDFGPSTASTNWSFNNLTFQQSSNTRTISTVSCATCGVTVNGILLVGPTASYGSGFTFNAGDKTWTLAGTSTDPLDTDQDTITFNAQTSTFAYTGNATGTVNLENAGFYNLSLSPSTSETYTNEGALTAGGILTVGANATLSQGNYAFTVTGATSVTGIVNTITGATGTRTFTGAVTVNSGGTFDTSAQDPAVSFGAGIVQNSANTLYTGSGAVTLVGNLSGSGAGNIDFGTGGSVNIASGTTTNNFTGAQVKVIGTLTLTGNWTQGANSYLILGSDPAISGAGTFAASASGNTVYYSSSTTVYPTTYYDLVTPATLTNTGTVTVNNLINGVGTFVNSTNATLNIGFADASGATTITATASGNTVNYTAASPTCQVITYHHLNFTGSGSVTCAVTTVGGDLGTSGTVSWTTSSNIVVSGDLVVGTGTTLAGTNNITVNGGDVTGAGDINMTGGTFLVDGASTTGFGSATAWDFYALTFGDGTTASTTTVIGAGGITVANNLLVAANQTVDFVTNGPTLDVVGNFTINSLGVFLPGSSWSIGGSYTNSGTLTDSGSDLTLNGSASANFNSGCADYTNCPNQDFYNIYINKAGTDANDNVTLTGNLNVAGRIRITDGELIQGNYDVYVNNVAGTAVDIVDSTAKWTNIGTGDLKLGGGFASAGVVTFNSNNGTQCVDAANDIVISSTVTDTVRTWSGAGTFTMYNVDVYDMSDGAITITIYTSTKDAETDWTHGSCGISIQGVVYMSNESTVATTGNSGPCDGSTAVISIRRNNGTASTGFCNGTTGAYNINLADGPTAGDTITVYLTSTMKANTVYISDGTADTGIDLYENTVVVGNVNAGATTIADLWDYDSTQNDTDLLFNATDDTTDTLVVEDGVELHVRNTFTPTGTVTTSPSADGADSNKDGDIHIISGAELTAGGAGVYCGGDFINGQTFIGTTPLYLTATSTGHIIQMNGDSLSSLIIQDASGGYSTSGAISPVGTLTVNGTLSGSDNITVVQDIAGTGTINMSGGTVTQFAGANENFGTTSGTNNWTFNNLAFRNNGDPVAALTITTGNGTGAINVADTLSVGNAADTYATILDAGNKTWNIAYNGSSGTDVCDPYQSHDTLGQLTASGSTFNYLGTCTASNVNVENVTYNNLILSGSDSFDFEGDTTINRALKVDTGATLSGTDNVTVKGSLVGNGTVNKTSGTVILDGAGKFAGNSSWTFNDLHIGEPVSVSAPGSPTSITDCTGLQNMSNNLSGTYVLANDIDCSATSGWNAGAGFVPLGPNGVYFTGIFDGQNYTISDLYINRPTTDYQGLFGYLSGANVRNVRFTNAVITAQANAGVLAGSSYASTITNVFVSGTVTSTADSYINIGGLVGVNGSGTIANCHSDVDITANAGTDTNRVGGLVGMSQNSGTIIKDSSATGDVLCDAGCGGLVGNNGDSAIISNSFATGNVTGTNVGGLVGVNYLVSPIIENSYATGIVTSTGSAGGLVDANLYTGIIRNSYATGSVTATSTAGGLAAQNYDNSVIENSYATGAVYCTAVNTYNFIGGLSGTNDNYSSITNSYATGSVTAVVAGNNNFVGGLVGENKNNSTSANSYSTGVITGNTNPGGLIGNNISSSTCTNSFWDTQTSGQATSQCGTGKTTSEMKTMSTFTGAGWAVVSKTNWFSEDWYMEDGTDYPRIWLATYDASGSGSVTVNGSLKVGTGETLDAKGKTWTLNGTTGTPFSLDGILNDSANDSTFVFAGVNSSGNTTVPASTAYHNLTISPASSETFATTGNVTLSGTLTTNSNATWSNSGNLTSNGGTVAGTITVGGNLAVPSGTWAGTGNITITGTASGNGAINMTGGTFAVQGTGNFGGNSNWTFNKLTVGDPINAPAGGATAITNCTELQAMENNLSGSYVLSNDIDCSATSGWNSGAGFVPISSFTGTFDGQNYTISGLYINRSTTNTQGMFGGVTGAIKNVGLINVNITGQGYTGGLVGNMQTAGTITNSFVTGTVTGTQGVGGLAGYSIGTISNSFSAGSVVGATSGIGGLVGTNDNGGVITTSHSSASVVAMDSGGGLVGHSNDGSSISNSYATGNVSGEAYMGGLVGSAYNTAITNSYATGNITSTANYDVGGLAGNLTNGSSVSNSYATGTVIGINYVGGLVGRNYTPSTITNSYSVGSVTGGNSGGLVGANTGTCTNSFWDTENSGQETSSCGTGKLTSDFTDIEMFIAAGWDIVAAGSHINELWFLYSGSSYPQISWEFNPALPKMISTGSGNITVTSQMMIDSGTSLDLKGKTWTFSGATGAPLLVTDFFGDTTNTSTVVFSGVSTAGNILIPTSSIYNNLTFNGGETYQAAGNLVVNGDLALTAGTLSSANDVTVNGGSVTGNGDINQTAGTFTVKGDGSFGNDVDWDFYSLVFGDSVASTGTTTNGSGAVMANTLTINTNHELYGGSKTWILTGTGTPLTLSGTYTPASSTISYRGTGAVSVPNIAYYNLDFKPTSGSPTYTLPTGTLNIANNLVIGNSTNAVTATANSNDPIINVNGSLTIANGGVFTASNDGLMTVRGNWTNNGTFNNSGGTVKIQPYTEVPILIGGTQGTNFHSFQASPTSSSQNITLQFKNGLTTGFAGTLTLTGQQGKPIYLLSDSMGFQWTMNLTGTGNVTNAVIRDAACSGSDIVQSETNLDYGNNGACWKLVGRGSVGWTSSSGGGTGTEGGSSDGGVSCGTEEICDNFERATLGSSWTSLGGTPQIYNNSDFGGGSQTDNNDVYYNVGTFSNNQFAEAVVATIGINNDIHLFVRGTGPSPYYNAYILTVAADGMCIYKNYNGGGGYLDCDNASPYAVTGSVLRIEVNGTSIKGYLNGVLRVEATDADITTGRPGIGVQSNSQIPNNRVELWRAGNVQTGSTGGGEGGGGGGATP